MSGRHHEMDPAGRVRDQETEELGAGATRQLEPIEAEGGGTLPVAGGQRRQQIGDGAGPAVDELRSRLGRQGRGQQARQPEASSPELASSGVQS